VATSDVMQIAYDQEADVLYVSVGEPRRAITRELGDDVLLRVDPETGVMVGLTILNLSTRATLDALPVRIALDELPSSG
jgi:uncharacterized protein YuzE